MTAKKVTVGSGWRWTLRGLALVALVISGVLLTLRLIPSSTFPLKGSKEAVIATCLSPFDQIQGRALSELLSPRPGPPYNAAWFMTGPITVWSRREVTRCAQAASDREYIIEALGIGAIILIGLSFLPRRRPVVTVPVNPSVL